MIWTNFRGLIAGLAAVCVVFSVSAQTAVEKHGALRTEGPYLLNKNGNIVQLKGLSFYWSNPAWNGWSYYSEGTVDALADSWKCTVVRAAYDRDGGNNNGWDGVQRVINEAIKKGIYVLIDWHSHSAQNQESAAVAFFREQATRYKDTPNVIFEPYNEPIGSAGTEPAAATTWKQIKPYLQNVTQAIRDAGADNLVIAGTPYYCQFVNVAAGDPLKDKNGNPFKNLAYAFHFYAASHGQDAYYVKGGDTGGMEPEYLRGALGKIPLFVSEWGTTHSNGGADGKTYVDEANTDWWFSQFVDGDYHLSWCNWSASSFEASSAFSGGTSPSASGKIVQKHIKTPSTDEFPPPSKIGKPGPSKDSVFTMPATHPIHGFNQYYGGYISATDVLYSDRDNVDVRTAANKCIKVLPGANGDWVSYYIKSSSATSKIIIRYLAKAGSGSMEIYLGNKSVGTLSINKGTTWTCGVLDAAVASGTDTLKFVFTNALENGFLVEWFELGNTNTCATNVVTDQVRPSSTLPPVTIAPAKSGFIVSLPPLHEYASYRLMTANGRVVRSGAIAGAAERMTLNNLPQGMWILELAADAGRKLYRVPVNGN